MEPIRILLAGMSRLMSDLIAHELARQSDMLVVGVLDDIDGLAASARRTDPDILVLGLRGTALPVECGALLADRPTLRVVGIEHDDADAGLYELRPRRLALGACAPTDLAVAIRAAAAAPARLWDVP